MPIDTDVTERASTSVCMNVPEDGVGVCSLFLSSLSLQFKFGGSINVRCMFVVGNVVFMVLVILLLSLSDCSTQTVRINEL